MKVRKRRQIKVTWEGWMCLQNEMHKQRSETGKPLSEKAIERMKNAFDDYKNPDGTKNVAEGQFGGCVGSPINAWEEGRWTSWSVEDMKRILEENGFEWEDAEDQEYISL